MTVDARKLKRERKEVMICMIKHYLVPITYAQVLMKRKEKLMTNQKLCCPHFQAPKIVRFLPIAIAPFALINIFFTTCFSRFSSISLDLGKLHYEEV